MEGATAPASTTPVIPQGNERPPEDANFYQQVYFHRLGTDTSQDTYVIGKDFPASPKSSCTSSDDGQWLIAAVGTAMAASLPTTSWTPAGTGPR